jgi:hypothetical protein
MMMMKVTYMIILGTIVLFSSLTHSARADNVLTPSLVHAIVANPISVFGKTYNLQIDNKTTLIYYGFHFTIATASKMSIIHENNSILISIKNVPDLYQLSAREPPDQLHFWILIGLDSFSVSHYTLKPLTRI